MVESLKTLCYSIGLILGYYGMLKWIQWVIRKGREEE